MKGIIALDIDGTTVNERHSISKDVVNYLSDLSRNGWKIIFITGRTFSWSYDLLAQLPFPHAVAVQNGAIILEMPDQKILLKKYLDKSVLPVMEQVCTGEACHYVIYGGYEFHDVCFFQPHSFSPEFLDYVTRRAVFMKETWEPVLSYDALLLEGFPSLKCFGKEPDANRIAAKIENRLHLHAPVIRDPFDQDFFVVQATHPSATKGAAMLEYKDLLGLDGVMIAAGDDRNDLSMLLKADVRVVMATAPEDVLALAHVVAPPALEDGIIEGLTQAIKWVQ
jgi:hypothetical protein